MAWTIEFEPAAIKQLKKLGTVEARRIRDFLATRVKPSENARIMGTPLQGPKLGHLWRYRVGDYRVLCDIQDNKLIVLVVDIDHRKQIYR